MISSSLNSRTIRSKAYREAKNSLILTPANPSSAATQLQSVDWNSHPNSHISIRNSQSTLKNCSTGFPSSATPNELDLSQAFSDMKFAEFSDWNSEIKSRVASPEDQKTVTKTVYMTSGPGHGFSLSRGDVKEVPRRDGLGLDLVSRNSQSRSSMKATIYSRYCTSILSALFYAIFIFALLVLSAYSYMCINLTWPKQNLFTK